MRRFMRATRSSRRPTRRFSRPDLTIGTVESFELNNATYYDVKVRLHTDIAALNNVLAVRYLDADERGALEQSVVAPEAE